MTGRTGEATIDAQVGERLRAARLRVVLTQGDLAQALGVDRSTVAKWESGERAMTAVALTRAADVLGIPPAALLEEQRRSAQHQAVQLLTQTLEQHPDLLPPMLAALERLLDQPSSRSS
ncbi:helix-turn-helix transcriptional regulator [Chloroflexales bacterium ZM16-3]|nr:helix-turn-helix transcriptional regulator [Chloroflexales bacterium ZM16-3]